MAHPSWLACGVLTLCSAFGCTDRSRDPALTKTDDAGSSGTGSNGGSTVAGGTNAGGSVGGGLAGGGPSRGGASVGAGGDGGRFIDGGSDAATRLATPELIFGPYKDTGINPQKGNSTDPNWTANVIATNVSGTPATLTSELVKNGVKVVTLAFATGECGSENWAGVAGSAIAQANVPLLRGAGIRYIVSTGGAAGVFSCGSDAGFAEFVSRWASPGMIGVDFDIEAGQSETQIADLVRRIKLAHTSHPALRFSLTLATLGNNSGADTAQSLGAGAQDSFNVYGDQTMAAVKDTFGFSGSASSWPAYLTINLMTMDYGAPGAGVCVVRGGSCQMGETAIQAAYNLHDTWGVPYANIEITPMIGGNDVSGEKFTLGDADTVGAFAISRGLSAVHFWSFDRDTDCTAGAASPTCNSMGIGYAGAFGYLKRFLAAGLR